jgi:hypothetical protein
MSEARGYAAFLQNAGLFFRGDSQGWHLGLVCDAPLGHGIGNTIVPFAPTGQRIPAQWNVIPSGSAHGIETPSFHLPQRGNAYQPNGT